MRIADLVWTLTSCVHTLAATIRVYMEKYEAPSAAPAAEGEEDAAEPAEGAEDGEDADAKLYVESAEALKDIVDAALKVSGLQVRNSSMLRCLHITSP